METHGAIETMLDEFRSMRIAGDTHGLADRFTEDASFKIVGFVPPIQGRVAVRAALKSLIDDYRFLEFRPIEMLIEGDRVATRHALKVRHTATGRTIETETAEFMTMQDGKVSSFVQYVDTRLAATLGET